MKLYIDAIKDKYMRLKNKLKLKRLKDKDQYNKIKIDVKGEKLSILKLQNSKSILLKMVCVFLLLIIVPVALIGAISSSSITNSVEKDAKLKLLDSTMQTSKYFNLFTKSVEEATMQLVLDQNIASKISYINDNKEDMFVKKCYR